MFVTMITVTFLLVFKSERVQVSVPCKCTFIPTVAVGFVIMITWGGGSVLYSNNVDFYNP